MNVKLHMGYFPGDVHATKMDIQLLNAEYIQNRSKPFKNKHGVLYPSIENYLNSKQVYLLCKYLCMV